MPKWELKQDAVSRQHPVATVSRSRKPENSMGSEAKAAALASAPLPVLLRGVAASSRGGLKASAAVKVTSATLKGCPRGSELEHAPPVSAKTFSHRMSEASTCLPESSFPGQVAQARKVGQRSAAQSARSSARSSPEPVIDVGGIDGILTGSLMESVAAKTSGVIDVNTHLARPDEVLAFRNMLTKNFGNITQAFHALKTIASATLWNGCESRGSLTREEFEWCTNCHLHYGDRRLSWRLFEALDRNGDGLVSLHELVQPFGPREEGLISMAEFRQRLLDRHETLEAAFQELEEHLDAQFTTHTLPSGARSGTVSLGCRRQSLKQNEFVEAMALLGLQPHQAVHFFALMDTDSSGHVVLNAFLEALIHMPREVLLPDFRRRLRARYSSVVVAFKEMSPALASSKGILGVSEQLGKEDFMDALARLGIVEAEASEVFRVIDADGSGAVSLQELQEALRNVAPTVTLDAFFRLVAAEWPEIAAAARQACAPSSIRPQQGLVPEHHVARKRVGCLLAELLPLEMRNRCAAPFSPAPFGSCLLEFPTEGRKISFNSDPAPDRSEDSGGELQTLTLEAFDAIAMLLDIPRNNAAELFNRMVEVTVGCIATDELYIEDFAEQLRLWTDLPEGPSTGNLAVQSLRRAMAPALAVAASLKAELRPSRPSTPRVHSHPVENTVSAATQGVKKQPGRLPRLPWQSHLGTANSVSARMSIYTGE